MKKLLSIIGTAVLVALSLVSCQKGELLGDQDSQPAGIFFTPIADPVFSVSATKQVRFTNGNLYWDGKDWKMEAAQTDFPREWNTSHIGHFFWTKTADAARAPKYSDGNCTKDDKFFADGSDADHMLTVEDQSDLYVLSVKEWYYLLSAAPQGRGEGDSFFKHNVTVNGVEKCLVIAPDGYTGTIASSYDAAAWDEAEAAGLVCLPAAGCRTASKLTSFGTGGYLSSSPFGLASHHLNFDANGVYPLFILFRFNGLSIRLVSTVPTATK